MKIHLFTFVLWLAVLCAAPFETLAQSPCPTDSIGGGGSGIAAMDSGIFALNIPPTCTTCDASGCDGWQLPDDFNGNVYLYGNSGDPVSIQIIQDCRYLLWDTCMVLPVDPASSTYHPSFAVVGNSQIVVCGALQDTFMIEVKATPEPKMQISTHVLDLTNCQTPTATTEPATEPTRYYELLTGKITTEPTPYTPLKRL